MKTERRIGNYMETASSKVFWPLDPRPSEVDINDIGHALSNICRFGGHLPVFYSVAQHSLMVSELCPAHLKLVGLLHDAPEAYIGDMIQPLKASVPQFRKIESKIWIAIAERFGISQIEPRDIEEVHHADTVAIVTESRVFLPNNKWWKSEKYVSIAQAANYIDPMPPAVAKKMFLERFEKLSRL